MAKKLEKNEFFFRSGSLSQSELGNLQRKVGRYQEILKNTQAYRQIWKNGLKKEIQTVLENMAKAVGLNAEINLHENIENLEAIQFSLGSMHSGMAEELSKGVHRNLIKHNGSLIYQQLFNGKISVILNYPVIEGYGQPAPPRQIGIYRPEELKEPFFLRHLEEFISEITNWEDYDDDQLAGPNQQAIGFKLNFEDGGEKV